MKEKLKNAAIIAAHAAYFELRSVTLASIAQGKMILKKGRRTCKSYKREWNKKFSKNVKIALKCVLVYAVCLIYAAATGIFYGSIAAYKEMQQYLERRRSFTVVDDEKDDDIKIDVI